MAPFPVWNQGPFEPLGMSYPGQDGIDIAVLQSTGGAYLYTGGMAPAQVTVYHHIVNMIVSAGFERTGHLAGPAAYAMV